MTRLLSVVFAAAVVAVPASHPIVSAVQRFNGLWAATQNAYRQKHWSMYRTDAEQLAGFLNGSPDAMLEATTIESGTERLDPTHGVLAGNAFYYIANAGWNQLAPDGSVRRGARLTPAVIKVIRRWP